MVKTLEPGAQLAIHAIRRASLKDGASCPVNTERVIAAQLSMRAFAQILLEAGRKLNLGEVEVQEFGTGRDVLLRVGLQPGGDKAQQEQLEQQLMNADTAQYYNAAVV